MCVYIYIYIIKNNCAFVGRMITIILGLSLPFLTRLCTSFFDFVEAVWWEIKRSVWY
jgi:hypothetical protein